MAKLGKPAPKKRLLLPKRFNVALTEQAYANLRGLNAAYGLGNNYLLTVLLENIFDIADPEKIMHAFDAFIAKYGAPSPEKSPAKD